MAARVFFFSSVGRQATEIQGYVLDSAQSPLHIASSRPKAGAWGRQVRIDIFTPFFWTLEGTEMKLGFGAFLDVMM